LDALRDKRLPGKKLGKKPVSKLQGLEVSRYQAFKALTPGGNSAGGASPVCSNSSLTLMSS
jgi:hypothetical protein